MGLGPVHVLSGHENYVNGLVFDPLGKFMASQSNQDKTLIIWKIHDNYRKFVQQKVHKDQFQNNQSQSQNARLDWSPDGNFIATTGGYLGSMYTSPIISRQDWEVMGHLKGHDKSVNITRFNPKLIKEPTTKLASNCYLATSGADSTITIWKIGQDQPFFVIKQAFHSGINDLSWGMEGNLLFACSGDGEVMACHFRPGVLGQFMSEREKDEIYAIYGDSVMKERRKNNRVIE